MYLVVVVVVQFVVVWTISRRMSIKSRRDSTRTLNFLDRKFIHHAKFQQQPIKYSIIKQQQKNKTLLRVYKDEERPGEALGTADARPSAATAAATTASGLASDQRPTETIAQSFRNRHLGHRDTRTFTSL